MTTERSKPRVPLVDDAKASPAVAATFERLAGTRGSVTDVFRALAHSSGALSSVASVGEHIRYRSSLDPELRELAILTVAKVRRCDFEWEQHVVVAKELEIGPEVLEQVGTPQLDRAPEPIGPAVRYCRALAKGDEVDDETFERVHLLLGNQGVVDLTVLVGYYGLLANAIDAFGIAPEAGA